MNGSRNVNMWSNALESVGEKLGGIPGKYVGKFTGALTGGVVDKYGPKLGKGAVDTAARMARFMETSKGAQTLGKFAAPLTEAAKKGNHALAATHAMLFANEPDYREIMTQDRKRNAIKQRLAP